jgi:hypothetical protein
MLYPLYFLTCLASNSAHCEMRVQHFTEISTPQQCLIIAQPSMAAWQAGHDRWRVARFRCGKPPKDNGTRV